MRPAKRLYSFKRCIFIFILITFLLLIFFVSPFFKEKIKGAFSLFLHDSPEYNSKSYILTKMGECLRKKYSSECYRQLANDFFRKFTLEEILATFKKNEANPELLIHCHEVAHYLGQKEYQRLKSIPDTFASCQHACIDGCYHGAVEGYFIEKGITLNEENYPIIVKEIPHICGEKEETQYFTCLHGLGHAVMFLADYDLPEALKLCDALREEDERDLCYTGAFMANVTNANSTEHPSRYIKADDPFYPCPILNKRYQRICYTDAILQSVQADVKKAVELCSQVPLEYRERCFRNVGRDRILSTTNPQQVKEECDIISQPQYREACYRGAANYFIGRSGIDSPIAINAITFCPLLDSSYKFNCYKEVIRTFLSLTGDPDRLQVICHKISEEKYRQECLRSITKKE